MAGTSDDAVLVHVGDRHALRSRNLPSITVFFHDNGLSGSPLCVGRRQSMIVDNPRTNVVQVRMFIVMSSSREPPGARARPPAEGRPMHST